MQGTGSGPVCSPANATIGVPSAPFSASKRRVSPEAATTSTCVTSSSRATWTTKVRKPSRSRVPTTSTLTSWVRSLSPPMVMKKRSAPWDERARTRYTERSPTRSENSGEATSGNACALSFVVIVTGPRRPSAVKGSAPRGGAAHVHALDVGPRGERAVVDALRTVVGAPEPVRVRRAHQRDGDVTLVTDVHLFRSFDRVEREGADLHQALGVRGRGDEADAQHGARQREREEAQLVRVTQCEEQHRREQHADADPRRRSVGMDGVAEQRRRGARGRSRQTA